MKSSRKATQKSERTKLKVLSLFSGIGGIDLGFHKAGFEIVATLDFDPKTCRTLEANRGKWISDETKVVEGDITTITPKDLYDGPVDFVIGGPPCQTFSAIGRRAGGAMGTKDARGELFEHYCRLLKHYQPKGFLFENVRGILYANKGKDWQRVLNAFRELGYILKFRVLDAAGFGAAQHRERVVLVGYKKGEFFFPQPQFGPDSPNNNAFVSAREAFKGLGKPKEEKLEMNGGKYDGLLADIPPGMNYLYYTKEMGHPKPKFAWRSKFSDFLYKANPDTPTKTLVAKMGRYSGPFHWENRRLSIDELKRLQGFPDDFVVTGSRSGQIMQIGNSVVPLMAYYLGLAVRKSVFGMKTEVDLLPDNAVLYIDSRKGEKAAKTKKATNGNKKPKAQLGLFSDSHANKAHAENMQLPKEGYLVYKKDSIVVSDIKTASSWRIETAKSNDEIIVSLSKEGVTAKNNKAILTLSLDFDDGILPVKTIRVRLLTVVSEEIFVVWDALNFVINKISSYPSIHELYGHFTEPNPKFSLSVKADMPEPRDPYIEVLLWSANLRRVNELHSLGELSILGFRTESEKELVQKLRGHRFDIRTNITNKQIPEGMFRICYPYTLPYDRRSFVTINSI